MTEPAVEVAAPATVHRPGMAPIKAQYLRRTVDEIHKRPREEDEGDSVKQDEPATKEEGGNDKMEGVDGKDDGAGERKGNDKWDKRKKNKKDLKSKSRGMNKARPNAPIGDDVPICNEFIMGQCSRGASCKYPHDVDAFLQAKGPDLGPKCYVFETYGKCRFGPKCRFSASHTGPNHTNLTNDEIVAKVGDSLNLKNIVPKKDLVALRKASTPNADDAIAWVEKSKKFVGVRDRWSRAIIKQYSEIKAARYGASEVAAASVAAGVSELEKPSEESEAIIKPAEGDIVRKEEFPTGEDYNEVLAKMDPSHIKEQESMLQEYNSETEAFMSRFPEKKKLDLRGKLYLAPLTTVGNVPFRRVAKHFGADVTCGEMAVANHLLTGAASEWALVRRHPSEDIFGVQISAHTPQVAAKAAEMLRMHAPDIDFVDLNCGCPIDLITNMGAGSALLERRNRLREIVMCLGRVLTVPVSVKLRTGIFSDRNVAHKLVPLLRDSGASIITLHGRSKEQRYTKFADWDYINQVAAEAGPDVTFFGNGDVFSFDDYRKRMEDDVNRNVSGVMIGRAALIKPWVFTEIKERRLWDIRSSERLSMLQDFANFGLEHWGSDTKGVNNTRKYLLEWLSFLYRYIPVELLEVLPQRLNERPPPFYGRDDLETLMASPIVTDWIKITELVLGPAPSNFVFIPKHKSNSYDSEAGMAYSNVEG
ncbi:tRNA-dihydrouridine(47) synthase [NAD(P)(+)]-like protein [Dinochytrium kinnereticum]|nr:tRNA-dihydrouridine(47) synthase [NAD(P)(+)]-like protein [Dinochytrium kinnereticum]